MDNEQLAERLMDGDEKALEEVTRKYTPLVSTIIANIANGCFSSEDIEEATSDTFIALWYNRNKIQKDKLKGFSTETDFAKFRRLHDTIYHGYQKVISPDTNVLYKMRELWSYWQTLFDGKERDIKRLLKAKKYAEYEDVVYRGLLSVD